MKQTDQVDRETAAALSKRAWQIYVEITADRGPLDVDIGPKVRLQLKAADEWEGGQF